MFRTVDQDLECTPCEWTGNDVKIGLSGPGSRVGREQRAAGRRGRKYDAMRDALIAKLPLRRSSLGERVGVWSGEILRAGTRNNYLRAQLSIPCNRADGGLENSKPVDHPNQETVDVRQGTGPRAAVSVLFISLALQQAPAGVSPIGGV